jgi:hypothetical protein
MRLYLLAFPLLLAAQPKLQNVKQQSRAVSGTLEATIKSIVGSQRDPAWIAYAAPQIPGDRQMCCWNNYSQGCALEPHPDGQPAIAPSGTVHLEGGTEFYIFLRVENNRIEKVRNFSVDCSVDGGGLPLFWLTGTNAAQSIAMLEGLIPATNLEGERRIADSAISAIAIHRDPAADAALDRLLLADRPENVRRQAAFWLGNARGRHGYEALAKLVREDPSDKVREHAISALAQSKEAEAIPTVARVAREDRVPHVRSQALQWLARRATRPVAEAAIRKAIDEDPDANVKKQAAQALSQIPNGGGIPLLIEIARTSKNEVVRKQALQTLSRSKDARASRFFEDVLAAR